MRRRSFLQILLAGLALAGATGHTPYRRWKIYRQRHLLIGTSRSEGATFPLGKAIAQILAQHLPESHARAARAPDLQRLASLIATGQIPILLVSDAAARELAAGRGPFSDPGPVALRTLYRFDRHVLVCRADFPQRHAWMVVRTLVKFGTGIAGATAPAPEGAPAPIHPGARAALRGEPEPDAPPDTEPGPAPNGHGVPPPVAAPG